MGHWVVGLYKSSREVRFFIVKDRKGNTLRELIRSVCTRGSTIVTDQSRGYSKLEEDGFLHKTINHSKWFVDPESGAHTQGIERVQVEGKAILKRHRHPTTLLQEDVDELAWKLRYKDVPQSRLPIFWRDVERVHNLANMQ